MFINNFKYKIAKARIIKVIYRHERTVYGKEYDDSQRDSISEPFGVSSSNISFRVYDKHDFLGDYRDVIWFMYDYKIVVEYCFNGTTYKKEIIVDNTSRTFEENQFVKVYFERKNPNNVYIKPTLEIPCKITPF